MNSTFEDSSSDVNNRVFLLSALGSAILHAAILAALAYIPSPPALNDPTPTVQVTLVPALQEISPTPQPLTKPLTPPQPDFAPPTPPSPRTQPTPSMPPPPMQASIKPTPSKPLAPPPPLPQAKPMLKDTRTAQAIKSRQMMKMAVPPQHRQRPPLAPVTTQREQPSARTPLQMNSREPRVQHALPPPPSPAARPALKTPPPMAAGSSTSKPKIVASAKPLYPRVARESGWEGTVIVRTLITADGAPSQVEIRKSCGHEALDLAAQEAIKNWKFLPAKDGNIPIAKWVDIPIKFDLNS
ncbi:energy transducer TonB [Nitrospira sp. T9]|uniref:energy transducer TonB n=1 Tax=unclassified Nitrospira TaxID=2652172 RepID=UPI003F9C5BC3